MPVLPEANVPELDADDEQKETLFMTMKHTKQDDVAEPAEPALDETKAKKETDANVIEEKIEHNDEDDEDNAESDHDDSDDSEGESAAANSVEVRDVHPPGKDSPYEDRDTGDMTKKSESRSKTEAEESVIELEADRLDDWISTGTAQSSHLRSRPGYQTPCPLHGSGYHQYLGQQLRARSTPGRTNGRSANGSRRCRGLKRRRDWEGSEDPAARWQFYERHGLKRRYMGGAEDDGGARPGNLQAFTMDMFGPDECIVRRRRVSLKLGPEEIMNERI
jgi:hypothetical protein